MLLIGIFLFSVVQTQSPCGRQRVPRVIPVFQGLYQSAGSQSTCNLALKDFYDKNQDHCESPVQSTPTPFTPLARLSVGAHDLAEIQNFLLASHVKIAKVLCSAE